MRVLYSNLGFIMICLSATVVETRRIFWTFITAMLDIEEYAD